MYRDLTLKKKEKFFQLYKDYQKRERIRVLCVNHLLYYLNFGLFAAMGKMGYTVCILPLAKYAEDEQKDILSYWLKQFKPHLVFTPGWSINLFAIEVFLDVVKSHEVPHLYWATEDPLFFEEVSLLFAPHCDYVFTLAEECNLWYAQRGIPSSTLTFACNPDIFKPLPPRKGYSYDLVLAANNYYWFAEGKKFRRQAIDIILKPLVDGNYNLKVWGGDWTNPQSDYIIPEHMYGGYIDYRETPYLYSSAKIVLGLQSVNNSLTQTSCRTYEIMGTGAFHLTPFTPAYANFFRNFEHVVWSTSPEETLEIVDYYLQHEEERKKIAKKAREEILARHTYMHRVRTMEKKLMAFIEDL
ncbi:Spore maturation protein CgeB [Thermosyntropha lipolytica DSM 11003]|uniref:Spore maturation protein CgeB n=1 Tax=Thermosyntropha lipolytica DSM 11003 TaxID=1123382 RepID=A0A1M5PBV0_9FIRM|nr:glycosyltransferase [Thermosyntropha lipolytica]SHG98929.1 Spore maturation protein CgeB [Thermosyntropha lipolytica DSM 11003]